jgi:hypothetical protein
MATTVQCTRWDCVDGLVDHPTNERQKIPCPTCKGSGTIFVTPELHSPEPDALKLVPSKERMDRRLIV